MIILRLDDLLQERGRTRYWLAKESGVTQSALYSMVKKGTTQVRFETLNRLCRVLECQPGDLLVYVPDVADKKTPKKKAPAKK